MAQCTYTTDGKMQCKESFITDTCTRPNWWCTHPGAVYKQVDFIRNGIYGDHLCVDTQGNTGTILRSDNCESKWPSATISPTNYTTSTSCPRPNGWCSHPGAIYRTADYLKNGVYGDHICIDKVSTGTILRSQNCVSSWPNAYL